MFPFHTPENTRKPLSNIFRGYKMETLARNKLMQVVFLQSFENFSEKKWWFYEVKLSMEVFHTILR